MVTAFRQKMPTLVIQNVGKNHCILSFFDSRVTLQIPIWFHSSSNQFQPVISSKLQGTLEADFSEKVHVITADTVPTLWRSGYLEVQTNNFKGKADIWLPLREQTTLGRVSKVSGKAIESKICDVVLGLKHYFIIIRDKSKTVFTDQPYSICLTLTK